MVGSFLLPYLNKVLAELVAQRSPFEGVTEKASWPGRDNPKWITFRSMMASSDVDSEGRLLSYRCDCGIARYYLLQGLRRRWNLQAQQAARLLQ